MEFLDAFDDSLYSGAFDHADEDEEGLGAYDVSAAAVDGFLEALVAVLDLDVKHLSCYLVLLSFTCVRVEYS